MSSKEQQLMDLERNLRRYAEGDVFASGPGNARQLVELDPERASAFARSIQDLHARLKKEFDRVCNTGNRKKIHHVKNCMEMSSEVCKWLIAASTEASR